MNDDDGREETERERGRRLRRPAALIQRDKVLALRCRGLQPMHSFALIASSIAAFAARLLDSGTSHFSTGPVPVRVHTSALSAQHCVLCAQ